MSTFINLSNHPSATWDSTQLEAALEFGTIVDMPFPAVDADADRTEIEQLVSEYYGRVMEFDDPVVMVQGEFTFTVALVVRLVESGIKAVCACTRREAVSTQVDGKTVKKSVFSFRGFREYFI